MVISIRLHIVQRKLEYGKVLLDIIWNQFNSGSIDVIEVNLFPPSGRVAWGAIKVSNFILSFDDDKQVGRDFIDSINKGTSEKDIL